MNLKRIKEKREMIADMRARLYWYTHEASDAEYDEVEVKALLVFLDEVDPIEFEGDFVEPENGWNRFWKYYEPREDENEKVIMSFEDRLAAKQTETQTKFARIVKPLMKHSTAAVLVVALFLGGTVGAYAQKEGFFYRLSTGEEKDTVITSPSGFEFVSDKYLAYENIEDVPINYVRYVWAPLRIPEELELQITQLADNKLFIKSRCDFVDAETKRYIYAFKKSYKETVVDNDRLYDEFNDYCEKDYGAIKVEYKIKENEDYTEYVAIFEYENCSYTLIGNIDFETIENIIEENLATKNY